MSFNDLPPDRPNFDPDIPDFLLKDLSDKEKWLYTRIGRSEKINEYVLDKLDEHTGKLSQIDEKAKFTNGKIGNAIRDIEELRQINLKKLDNESELNKIVTFKKFVTKWLFNRYALGVLLIFVFGLYKVVSDEQIRELFTRIFGF